jgi:Tfp pilus assembly protein PilX
VVTPGKLELNKGGKAEVIVSLMTAEGCPPKVGEKITAKVEGGKKHISVSPRSKISHEGHQNGEATFVITAKNKKGNTKVLFRYKNFKTTLKVKVVK